MAEQAENFILENEGIRSGDIVIRLAQSAKEVEAAQALRYRIFYNEQNAQPVGDMAALQRDYDDFDALADHLLVFDVSKPDLESQVVGNYRIIHSDVARKAGKFYTELEFDISKLKNKNEKMIELGRACVEAPYRTKPILQLLWQGLAEYMLYFDIRYFMGCATFPELDLDKWRPCLSYLQHYHLAPDDIRPIVKDDVKADIDLLAKEEIDAKRTFMALPPLLKGYLRVGAVMGEGYAIDEQWDAYSSCVLFKTTHAADRYRKHYERKTNAIFEAELKDPEIV